MTKAIIIQKPGGPEVLEITDIKLEAPGPDQIKVKNIAIGLNYIDTYIVQVCILFHFQVA